MKRQLKDIKDKQVKDIMKVIFHNSTLTPLAYENLHNYIIDIEKTIEHNKNRIKELETILKRYELKITEDNEKKEDDFDIF